MIAWYLDVTLVMDRFYLRVKLLRRRSGADGEQTHRLRYEFTQFELCIHSLDARDANYR